MGRLWANKARIAARLFEGMTARTLVRQACDQSSGVVPRSSQSRQKGMSGAVFMEDGMTIIPLAERVKRQPLINWSQSSSQRER